MASLSKFGYTVYGLAVLTALQLALAASRLLSRLAPTLFNPAPLPSDRSRALLVTIRYSHYVEKARFALDLLRRKVSEARLTSLSTELQALVNYEERAYTPLLHMIGTKSLAFYSNAIPYESRSTSSAPALIMPEEILHDSSLILTRIDQHMKECGFIDGLYPAEHTKSIHSWQYELDRSFGPAVRICIYHLIFESLRSGNKQTLQLWKQELLRDTHNFHIHTLSGWFWSHFWTFLIQSGGFSRSMAELMALGMKIHSQSFIKSKQRIIDILTRLNRELTYDSISGQYRLYPSTNGSGDLNGLEVTLAALSYPIFLTEGTEPIFPGLTNSTIQSIPELVNLVNEIRQLEGGRVYQLVKWIYQEKRGGIQYRLQGQTPNDILSQTPSQSNNPTQSRL